MDKARRHDFHNANINSPDEQEGQTAEILSSLSKIDDLPIKPEEDAVMGQLVSRLVSTTNLTSEQVRSNEWIREYLLILYLSKFPTKDGVHGSKRAFAHDDPDAARPALSPEKRTELEAFISTSNLALNRSEDAKVIEESVRNVNESIVNEDSDGSSGGGLLGRWRS